MDDRQGNMTNGKLIATDKTKPSFINSVNNVGEKDVRIFPWEKRDQNITTSATKLVPEISKQRGKQNRRKSFLLHTQAYR